MPDSSRHRKCRHIGIHSWRELESGSAGNRADTGTGLRASSGAKPSAKNAGRRVAGLISLTGGQDGQASHVSWFVGKAGGAAGNANQWTGRDRPGGTLEDILQSRSDEHTSELKSLMRNSYAVFCM